MYFYRDVDLDLLEWKDSESRKPLLIRGARQVGKSSAVKNFAQNFKYYLEVNFEEENGLKSLFEQSLTVEELITQLAVIKQTPIIEGETLIFFDEIQVSIPAISSLRYFYERKPKLHVIAAGSLLEFALAELPSFGVGRVRSLFMYPFAFNEFLMALNEGALLDLIKSSSENQPLNSVVHVKLNQYLKKYFIIGGMPEAVRAYAQGNDLLEVQRILNDLVISIQSDFRKYNKRVPVSRIQAVFESVVRQTGSKYKYSNAMSDLNSVQIKQALDLLELAGLLHTVTHSSCNGIPLGAESNPKKRKFLIFDTGIFQRMLGLDIAGLLLNDDYQVINNGAIAELFVGLELIKNTSRYEKMNLHYWHREEKSSQAEVDYVVQMGAEIVPIEVKAGSLGKMKSLHLFLREKQASFGVRCSLENFDGYEKIKTLPLYAIGHLFKSIKH
jgi:predicted AAA+ superfamily ATPase